MSANVKKAAKPQPRSERFRGLAEQIEGGDPATSRLVASELSGSIGFLLRLANGVSQEQLGRRLDALGLRPTLYSLLLIIHENPGLKQQEIGQTLSIQQPNLVALINELVNNGHVSRSVNIDDRRSYSLNLTPAGDKLLQQARRAHEANERRLIEALHPLTADQVRKGLRGILAMSGKD